MAITLHKYTVYLSRPLPTRRIFSPFRSRLSASWLFSVVSRSSVSSFSMLTFQLQVPCVCLSCVPWNVWNDGCGSAAGLPAVYVSVFKRVLKMRRATVSSVMACRLSVRPHGKTRVSLHGFLWNLVYINFFRKSIEKVNVWLKSDKNNGTLLKGLYTFMVISRSFLLRMRNILDKSCREI